MVSRGNRATLIQWLVLYCLICSFVIIRCVVEFCRRRDKTQGIGSALG